MADVNIEEANKIRVAMGLKPLPVPGAGPVFKSADDGEPGEEQRSTLETREAAAGDNWLQLQKEAADKEARQKRKEAAKKAREAAEREKKLVGIGLADLDDDLDTRSWLKQQKKRQRGLEEKRLEEEEAAKRQKRAEYTAQDLAGVQVGHELGEFDNGDEQILTLKDQMIGDESEEDELENADLREKAKLQERLELKKKKPVYNPLDDDGTGQKSILSHYDEEIDGKKRQRFTLDGFGNTVEQAQRSADTAASKAKGVYINLDILDELKPTSDYLDISEIKVKKPKKSKKTKTSRKKADDEDDMFGNVPSARGTTNGDGSGENGVSAAPKAVQKKPKREDINFFDDDDLQASLARSRNQALKQRQKMRPEDLARQLREEESNEMDGVEEDTGTDGLLVGGTSDFVSSLALHNDEDDRPKPKREPSRDQSGKPELQADTAMADSADEDEDMQDSYGAAAEAEDRIKREQSASAQHEISATGLEEEKTLGSGLAATMKLLRDRGQLKDTDAHDVNSKFIEQQRFLADRKKREDELERRARQQRERDRASGRFNNLSKQEQEEYNRKMNTQRENQESRELANLFNRDYQPNFEIKYVDEHGRHMNQKEAFKHQSHKFHGKTSGKAKTEKKLKKIAEEKKVLAMGVVDSSSNSMNAAMGDKAKKSKQAGIRIQ